MRELLTTESVDAFRAATSVAAEDGQPLLFQYDQERASHLDGFPNLQRWKQAIENFDFPTASDPTLLAAIARNGFLVVDNQPADLRPDSAMFRFKLIAPKIVDAFLVDGKFKVDYAYNSLYVCSASRPSRPRSSSPKAGATSYL